MEARDLITLPLGKYNIVDKVCNYTLSKSLTEEKTVIYRIYKDLAEESIALFESEVNVFEDDDKYKRINIISLATLGALCVHSDDNYRMLRDLSFVARGSFSKFIELTENK